MNALTGDLTVLRAVPPWEAAARDLNSETMPGHEDVARRPKIDLVPVTLACGMACPEDSVAQIERTTVRMDVITARPNRWPALSSPHAGSP